LCLGVVDAFLKKGKPCFALVIISSFAWEEKRVTTFMEKMSHHRLNAGVPRPPEATLERWGELVCFVSNFVEFNKVKANYPHINAY